MRRLLAGQSLAVVATQAESALHASLVAFVATPDLRRVAFATPRTTRKFANLAAHPRVALLMDDRSHSRTDFYDATAITVVGEAYEAWGDERQALLALYLQAHPHLRDFVDAPICALVAVRVERYSVVTQFQNVMELVCEP